jgi:hypothetical protein
VTRSQRGVTVPCWRGGWQQQCQAGVVVGSSPFPVPLSRLYCGSARTSVCACRSLRRSTPQFLVVCSLVGDIQLNKCGQTEIPRPRWRQANSPSFRHAPGPATRTTSGLCGMQRKPGGRFAACFRCSAQQAPARQYGVPLLSPSPLQHAVSASAVLPAPSCVA